MTTQTAGSGHDEVCRSLDLALDLERRIHFAGFQNDIPLIRLLRLENVGDEPLLNLSVEIGLAGGFSLPWKAHVERLEPGEIWNLHDLDILLDRDQLAGRSEREKTACRVVVRSEADGRELLDRSWPVDVLPINEWPGLSSLPELLAAFSLPNSGEVQDLLAAVRNVLASREQRDAVDGYQTHDARRVRDLVEACWTVLADLELGYVAGLASFEAEGQRIRLPSEILERRQGNCLDLTLLAVALLEAAGLNALVVLFEDHALPAVWLMEDSFAEPAMQEGARLTQRVRLGEILVFESTLVTAGRGASLDDAVSRAESELIQAGRFHTAIDLAACRRRRIRPLSTRAHGLLPSDAETEVVPERATSATARASAPEPSPAGPPHTQENGTPRIEGWKRRLLDISLRNRLINFRPTKRSLPILTHRLSELEDALAGGGAFEIHPAPDLLGDASPRSPALHRQMSGEDLLGAYLEAELAAGRLRSDLTAEELVHRLVQIYRAARLSLEESGANTLFLALGFVRWSDPDRPDVERKSPLVLVPVQLERRRGGLAFRLSASDDEARINVTLLEKLKQDHGIVIEGLDPLPEDEAGIDLTAVFGKVRAALKDLARWDIAEEAWLGLFSFAKFLMWRDLEERSADLMQNPVVRHLVERPTEAFEGGLPAEEPEVRWPPSEVFCPLDADASQLSAILAAAKGASFVLEGPPGTGKSQTITNLIAQTLAEGKTVLFVAEKRAALEVVHRRLQQVGLHPFCLELHSDKAKKRDVLRQLEEAMEAQRPPGMGDDGVPERLARVRDELDAFREALHRTHPLGISVQTALDRVAGLGETELPDPLPSVSPALTKPEFEDALEATEDLAAAMEDLVDLPSRHPLRGIGLAHEEAAKRHALARDAGGIAEVAEALLAARRDLLTLLALAGTAAESILDSRSGLRTLASMARLLERSPHPTRVVLESEGWAALKGRVEGLAERLENWIALRDDLLRRWEGAFLEDSTTKIEDELRRAVHGLGLLRPFRLFRLRRRLASWSKTSWSPESLADDLEKRSRYQEEDRDLWGPGSPGRELLGELWTRGRPTPANLHAVVAWAEQYRGAVAELLDSLEPPERAEVHEHLVRLAIDRDEKDRAGILSPFRTTHDDLERRLEAFCEDFRVDEVTALGAVDEPGFLGRLVERCGQWRESVEELSPWCHWRHCVERAEAAGLGALAVALGEARIPPTQARRVAEHMLLTAWSQTVVGSDPVLSTFQPRTQDRRVARFQKLDRAHLNWGRRQIQERLAERAPDLEGRLPESSEAGVLRRQLRLKRRHMPLRKLFEAIPHLLPRLKPCLLMSPLSVAQYLDPAFPPFDLVVFDEASQIPPWDAVGAIARGAHCVVVGDSKQLPPTTFFQAMEGEDVVADDEILELESVLDECIAAGLPSKRLLWHYRSRHEDLIAFSNFHYYEGRLQTFPAAQAASPRLGVAFVHVEGGVYDRGGSRSNRVEAEVLVEDLVARLRDPQEPEERKSIGVVTFSRAQQDLVEDLLDAARAAHPEIDPYFGDEVDEPVFVKNLENVQGDERTVMLFSVGYGPDSTGRIAMNFGPLNREGGERRLNVAVTRAREQLVVYASLKASDIDLSRTRATGAAHLKVFLDYAEKGPRAMAEALHGGEQAASQSGLVEALSAALREEGFEVREHMGSSSRRIPLAIRRPGEKDGYVLDVETDGAVWGGTLSARDRERLREQVLESLGWRVERVWSLEWQTAPTRVLRRLVKAVSAEPEADSLEEPDSPLEGAVTPDVSPEAPPPPAPPESATSPASPSQTNRYEVCHFPDDVGGTREDFFSPRQDDALLRMIEKVLEVEAPLAFSALCRRVAAPFGVLRTTGRVQVRVEGLVERLPQGVRPTQSDGFLWRPNQDPHEFTAWRARGEEDESRRSADEIPREEMAAALEDLLLRHGRVQEEDLLREAARLLGFSRMGSRLSVRFRSALDGLVGRGGAERLDDGRVAPPQTEPRRESEPT